jgi:Zn-dependent protease with chaperone function
MNFFQRQAGVRRTARLLVVVFVLTVVAIVAAVGLVVANAFGVAWEPGMAPQEWLRLNAELLIWSTMITLGIIVGASLYKTTLLRAGGGAVARSLGATPVPPDVTDPLRRRLRNVVEEIAIASGVPVPEIYVLEEEGAINAFAAGYTPSDAAVAVTRGALERLDRAELQGVIAHEFSHILNGDMRLNMRLLGTLFGVMAIGLAGRLVLHGLGRGRLRAGRRTDGRAVAAMLALGLTLIVIGYVGVLGGRLIKAAVSRQREYLADASAVQFTRYPAGIAGALKKIAGFQDGSRLRSVDGEQISHMLFAGGISSFATLLSTHPPIVKRIQAIEPGFDPKQLPQSSERVGPGKAAGLAGLAPAEVVGGLAPAEFSLAPEAIVQEVGNPARHFEVAARIHAALPAALLDAAHSPQDAVALYLALLVQVESPWRERQLALVEERLGGETAGTVGSLTPLLARLGAAARLPLLELAFPALKRRPSEQVEALLALTDALIEVDERVSVFEYALSRLARAQLIEASAPGARGRRPVRLSQRIAELQVLFAVLARVGHPDEREAQRAYEAGLARLLPLERPPYRFPADWTRSLDAALEGLDALHVLSKEDLLTAMTQTILHDGKVTVHEAELLRAICGILHCPLPPLYDPGAGSPAPQSGGVSLGLADSAANT